MTPDDKDRCEAFLRAFPNLTKEQIEALRRNLGAEATIIAIANNQINSEKLRDALSGRLGGGR